MVIRNVTSLSTFMKMDINGAKCIAEPNKNLLYSMEKSFNNAT